MERVERESEGVVGRKREKGRGGKDWVLGEEVETAALECVETRSCLQKLRHFFSFFFFLLF